MRHRLHRVSRHDVRAALRLELRPTLRLAAPIVLAELGWMAMGIVDTMMVGRVSAEAIGAVAIGSNFFYPIALFGIGMLLGLDYTIAYAVGARDSRAAQRSLVQGIYLAVLMFVLLTPVLWLAGSYMPLLGFDDAVVADGVPYLHIVTWSLLPLLLFTALRRYLQARNFATAIMVTLLTANVINAAADWVLVFGHFGAPRLGAQGAAWATLASRLYMLLALVGYALYREWRGAGGLLRGSYRPHARDLWKLAVLGLPAAFEMILEAGVFAAAAALAARVDSISLAAHQIALICAAFTFMVPLGVSSAAAVRVGQGLGRHDPAGAARAGWTAVLVGAVFMSFAGMTFVLFPGAILSVYTTAPAVIATGITLLYVAALFQLFDGVQVVATGALRGLGDTRTAMIANLVAHWCIGLPIGAWLCFGWGFGVVGLWVGLCVGLICVAVVLLGVWAARVERAAVEYAPARQAA